MRLRFTLSACLLAILPFSAAQTVQSALWRVPDGGLSDFSQTFTSSTTLGLSWNKFVYPGYIDTAKTLVDLWVTSYDINLSNYTQLLKDSVNLTSPGNLAWTIATPPAILDTSAKFVLRFKQHAADFDIDGPELSSTGFLVLRAAPPADPSTSSIQNSPTSTPTPSATTNVVSAVPSSSPPVISSFSTIITSASSTTSPPATSTPTPSPSSAGLSTPAIAGIAAGTGVAVLALLAALWRYLLILKRRPKAPSAYPPPAGEPKQYAYSYAESQPAELPYMHRGAEGKMAELPHTDADAKRAKLPVNWHVAELPGNSAR